MGNKEVGREMGREEGRALPAHPKMRRASATANALRVNTRLTKKMPPALPAGGMSNTRGTGCSACKQLTRCTFPHQ